MTKPGDVRIGVSGWTYPPWRGTFYPKKLPQHKELAHVGETFRTNEINGTFYGTQAPTSFQKWHDAVPKDFKFSMKGPRFITHILRLKDVAQPLANFIASGPLALGEKLGPILWQFPPSFKFDKDRIEAFFEMLPHDTEAASKLAKRHDARLKKGAWTKTDKKRKLRHAMEIRHESFEDPAFIKLLRAHKVALVCADTEKWPKLMDLTADFVYCRLHGSGKLYTSDYKGPELGEWAKRVAGWAQGKDPAGDHVIAGDPQERAKRDVFVYFDNTEKVHAPANALKLEKRVKELLAKKS
jgi:uncharacterized protein YecE (DUF72 family)